MNARQRLGIPMAVVARWGRWKVHTIRWYEEGPSAPYHPNREQSRLLDETYDAMDHLAKVVLREPRVP